MILMVCPGGGLTNLMFGFEFHTFMFAMLNAIVLGHCRAAFSQVNGPEPGVEGEGGQGAPVSIAAEKRHL